MSNRCQSEAVDATGKAPRHLVKGTQQRFEFAQFGECHTIFMLGFRLSASASLARRSSSRPCARRLAQVVALGLRAQCAVPAAARVWTRTRLPSASAMVVSWRSSTRRAIS